MSYFSAYGSKYGNLIRVCSLLILTTEERVIRTTSMLHDAQMAAMRKLQRRIGAMGERQVRAVHVDQTGVTPRCMPHCRKAALSLV